MKLPIYQIDAFTDRMFSGNPAAVVILESWLPDNTLRSIAAENNLAETAFVIPHGEVMPLRWFTPTVEVDLCGHATLATADVLFRNYFPGTDRLAFSTLGGNLAVTRKGDLLSLDFPAWSSKPVVISDAMVTSIGKRPRELFLARDLMAVYESEADIRDYQPDFTRISELDVFGLIITAPGDSTDYVYRFFAPRKGVPEDPVTGSANCTLVPYWSHRLGRDAISARQLSVRGGNLNCRLKGDRVEIAGHAVEYLRGEITVQESGS